MLHELVIEETRPGALPYLLEKTSTVGLRLRSSFSGMLFGAWTSEFGELNQLYSVWQYANLTQRNETLSALAADGDWQAHMETLNGIVLSREVRLLSTANVVAERITGNSVYDLRYYDIAPGRVGEFISLLLENLSVREKYSPNVGTWVPWSGNLHQVIHLWAYRDLAHRSKVRTLVKEDEHWQKYLSNIVPLLRKQRSVLLVPATYSPID